MKPTDYVIVCRLAKWGDQSKTNFFAQKKFVGSMSKIIRLENEFCEQWNKTHGPEQQAWISGCVWLKWPGHELAEKLYAIRNFVNDKTKVGGVYVQHNINKILEGVDFHHVEEREAWLDEHPEDK